MNGLEIQPISGLKAVTFMRSSTDSVYTSDGYLHIRYTNPSPVHIASIATAAGFPMTAYDPSYPVREGYYWIRTRQVVINGITISHNALKDSTAIVSFRYPTRYVFTSNPPPIIVRESEDYLVIIADENATVADLVAASGSLNIFTLSFAPTASYFTTAGMIPDWRQGLTYRLDDEPFTERRQFWDYEVEFADYVNAMIEEMRPLIAPIPIYHVSDYHRITDTQIGALLYMTTMQDKSQLPIYMKIPPFDTHHFYMGKVDFMLLTNDFFVYRGFHNRIYIADLFSNNVTSVRYRPTPAHQGYWAAVKWLRGELSPDIPAKMEDINSEKGYFQYQLTFAAELYYFAIRSKYAGASIQDILVHIVEAAPSPCTSTRVWTPKLVYALSGSSILPISTETTPISIQ